MIIFSVVFILTVMFVFSHLPSPTIALLVYLSGWADIGDPGYKAIPGSSWQLQEITATFLAHCPTAVKWHMLSYRWASSKKAPVWKRNLEKQNERPETCFWQRESCDIIALQIVTREVRDMLHRGWPGVSLYCRTGQHFALLSNVPHTETTSSIFYWLYLSKVKPLQDRHFSTIWLLSSGCEESREGCHHRAVFDI